MKLRNKKTGEKCELADVLFIPLYILLVPIAFIVYIFMPDDPETKARCAALQMRAHMRTKEDECES